MQLIREFLSYLYEYSNTASFLFVFPSILIYQEHLIGVERLHDSVHTCYAKLAGNLLELVHSEDVLSFRLCLPV